MSIFIHLPLGDILQNSCSKGYSLAKVLKSILFPGIFQRVPKRVSLSLSLSLSLFSFIKFQ